MAALSSTLNEHDLRPKSRKQIRKFLKGDNWDELNWLLTLIALEVGLKSFILEQVRNNINQMFAELVTGLILGHGVSDLGREQISVVV